jgi:hypothetical protein
MKISQFNPRTFLSVVLALFLLSGAIQVASAKEDGGNTSAFVPLIVQLNSGRAFFDIGGCNSGTCGARDIDPASTAPLRPWQSNLRFTGQGIQTFAFDAKGAVVPFIGMGTTACFNVPFSDDLSLGGINKYFVAYWDPTIDNCDNDWNTEGPNKTSLCKKSIKGNWYPLPNTSRQLIANRTYDVCGYLAIPASFALVVSK